MDVKIQTRNLSLSNQIKAQIQQKLEQVNRHLPGVTEAAVELRSEPTRSQEDRVVAQVTLLVNGNILRGENRGPTPLAAVNAVAETLDRRVNRYKSRAYRSERLKQTPSLREQQAEAVATLPTPEDTLPDGKVVRVKRFDIKPMTVDDAAFQMQMLGHRFFMFLNSESNQYNVLYLRDDGDYGLILPEAG